MKQISIFLCAIMAIFSSCDLIKKAQEECDSPWNTLCPANCTKVVRHTSVVWAHNAGDDFFTITIEFDKDIDETASGFASRNGIVVYQRPDKDQTTPGGADIQGDVTGSGKTWVFKSKGVDNAYITDPANFFELVLENSDDALQGVRSTDGGVYDSDSDCQNLTSELREFHQF